MYNIYKNTYGEGSKLIASGLTASEAEIILARLQREHVLSSFAIAKIQKVLSKGKEDAHVASCSPERNQQQEEGHCLPSQFCI